jgi:PAS domain S-box-containing protein
VPLPEYRRDPPAPIVPSQDEVERICARNLMADREERIFFKDRDSRFLFVNAGFLAGPARGRTLEDVIGKTDFDIFSRPHAVAAFADERLVIATGVPMAAKVERETFHDERPDAWVSTTKMALLDDGGAIVGCWGIARDITAQVQAELALASSREELRSSEQQHRVLFEHNPQPMMAYECATLRIVAVSSAMVAAYGYSRDELLSMTLRELEATDDLEPLERLLAGAHQERPRGVVISRPWAHRYKDGTIIDVELTSDDLMLDGKRCRIVSCQDVTQRNRALADLAIARDEAVVASKMKSAFLANVSHEIRTPMNGVLGMNDLLLETELDREQRVYAEQVARSGEQMMAIINDILDISKIEAGQLKLDVTEFDLRDCLEQACAVHRFQAHAKGVALELTIDDAVPVQARGDSRRLRQILANLVANAVKFTAHGSVTVAVSAPGGSPQIHVEVTDTGIGVDPDALDAMFEPFTQADVSTTRDYGGTGLGLAIARELVESMGGAIGATSAPGHGSTFWFDMTLADPDLADSRRRALDAGSRRSTRDDRALRRLGATAHAGNRRRD